MEIPGAAHHLDLRTPNTCDPNTVKNARFQIVGILDCWIHGSCGGSVPKLTDLPPLSIPDSSDCKDVNFGYPWGQSVSGSTLTTTAGFAMLVLLLRSFLFF
ncbi:putative serine protease pcp-1 [Trichostrongylus colubriformis]|uniref:Serine protease pcp-1 n=1 Tax=Trichostrongylus colubriformis TaxID=6319 RepID=A0AAN8FKC7_TRICO